MNKNPYDVLGVPSTASDDEIKKAYRDLTRRYHPDANVNNPLADLAEEKFKEVQEAYDLVMKDRANGGYNYGGNNSSSYNYGYGNNRQNNSYNYVGYSYNNGGYNNNSYNQNSGYSQQQAVEMQAVMNFINNRRFHDALNVLGRMSNRNAYWYYLSAIANNGIGNNIVARDHAAQACNMEPNNVQYRQLLTQLSWNTQRYQGGPYGGRYGGSQESCGTGNLCCDLWMMDTLCECMGGDICSCL